MKTLILLLLFPAPREVPPEWNPLARQGYIGVKISGSDFNNLDAAAPVQVTEVMPGLPADKGGLKAGDTIRQVNGTPVRNQKHCIALIKAIRVGELARLEVERPGSLAPLEVKIRCAERPADLDAEQPQPQYLELPGGGVQIIPR